MRFQDYAYSVIIPAWNRRAFIKRAIESVAAQDCIDPMSIEILVVDDGSTDGTADVAEKANVGRCALRVLRSEHTGHPGLARNIALKQARGEYVAYCDSDDYWLPHHLATTAQAFKKNPSAGMVANFWALAQFVVRPDGGIEDRIVVQPHPVDSINTNCRVHRHSCLEKVGYFAPSRWGEDQDFFGKVERAFPVVRTFVVTSVNGYIKCGNNLTYESDPGVKSRYF